MPGARWAGQLGQLAKPAPLRGRAVGQSSHGWSHRFISAGATTGAKQ